MLLPLVATLNLLDAVQNVLVIARYPEAVSILRILGNMMPGVIFHIYACVRAYHTELSFRIQFSGMKRAQSSIQKAADINQTMNTLLENILPKTVIPRLIASNYQFSMVTDRIPRAYCIFVDFFHGGEIKRLDPDVAASTLNGTFFKFDEMLTEFPMLEKIKTIGSKCMLMAIDDGNDHVAGSSVTRLAKNLQLELQSIHNNSSGLKADLKVGIAYGSIVAGVVGSEKFIYDIYSDTVNVASRMATLEYVDTACTAEAFMSFDSETSSHWEIAGTFHVKGKGPMEIYKLHYVEGTNHFPKPRISENQRKSSVKTSRSRSPSSNRLSVSPSPRIRRFSIMNMIQKGKMSNIWSPAAQFAKAVEASGLQVFGLDNERGKDEKSPKLSSHNDFPSNSVELGKFKSRIVPLDTSRYLDSETKINMEESIEACPALQDIINNLSSVIVTLTTDDLIPVLSQYITKWKLKFRDVQLERLYQKYTVQRFRPYILQHATVTWCMMWGFCVIISLYEAFLYGQVGYNIENDIRKGVSTGVQEPRSFQIGRFICLGMMTIAAVIQSIGVISLRRNAVSIPSYEKDWFGNSLDSLHCCFVKFACIESARVAKFSDHAQYGVQILLLVVFGLPFVSGTTYSKSWSAASAIIPLLNCAVAFTTRAHISYLTRTIVTISLNFD
ncbi:hypothetical protein HDU76_013125 [Blyttiomyces sp. JEL0837]|nr:hypothetical protein HDU76_013125 [Blyttiomyces sp. JEL0837]